MRVAYIFDPGNLHSTTFSGVVRQGITWAEGLSKLGIDVRFPVAHEAFDWSRCDLLHLFQYGGWAEDLVNTLKRYDIPAVLSPIVDRSTPYGLRGRLVSKAPFEALGLRQRHRTLSNLMTNCARVLARSELEKRSLTDISVHPDKIEIVRLGIEFPDSLQSISGAKAGHVFHMSHLNQERKNVRGLIEACEALNVPLRLAGKISESAFANWLESRCEANPSLKYIGPLTEEQKWEEMGKASVFCLPSLNEGIGLVAMEAYAAGAHLVLTNRTGGVEYFGENIEICDPASVSDIALCIDKAMKKPRLEGSRQDAIGAFANRASVNKLLEVYSGIVAELQKDRSRR